MDSQNLYWIVTSANVEQIVYHIIQACIVYFIDAIIYSPKSNILISSEV
jgi:hypothetical protein